MDKRTPTCVVVLAGPSPKLRTGDREAFGPFETEEEATLWLSQYLPERVIFTIFPVFDSV